jgi:hypothetical protein
MLMTGAGPLTFAPQGTERMRIDPTSGNALIGTTTDAGYRLDVLGGSARIKAAGYLGLTVESSGAGANDGVQLALIPQSAKGYTMGTRNDGRLFLYDVAAAHDILSYAQGGRLSIQPYGGDVTLANSLRIYTGGADGNSTGFGSIRTNVASGNTTINAPSGALYLNYDQGTGGVFLCGGASACAVEVQAAGNIITSGTITAGGGQSGGSLANANGGYGGVMVQASQGANAAFMAFNRPNTYAVYFGLDTDNQLKVGGWSMGANAYTILHSGNYSSYAPSKDGTGATGTWNIAISGNAGSASSVAWGNVSGRPTSLSAFTDDLSSVSATASTLVKRDANGYIMAGYVNTNISDEAIVPTSFFASTDTWIRKLPTASAYKALVNSQPHQINFVYGGSATQAIDNTTVNNVWRSHAYAATITEVACWTDAGTVTLAVKDSAGNQVTTGTLACSSSGASTASMNASYSLISSGEGLGFTTSAVSGVKNLSVSIKYIRAY